MGFISLCDVNKTYQMGEITIRAVDQVSFAIEKGDFAVVVGASGAGKTTILNILGGMDHADDGQIIVDGKDIARYSRKMLTEYRRYDIGFVFQFYNLVQNLTARENVELATQISHAPLNVDEVLELDKLGLKSIALIYVGVADPERDWVGSMAKVRLPTEDFVINY